jgi:UDP:flavonoid glycosyltransferase YjiC (YdhE family)
MFRNPRWCKLISRGGVVCACIRNVETLDGPMLTICSAGVPQVLIPGWIDCYDYGARVEYLGIGRWGNKGAMPGWTASELGRTLVDVVRGVEAPAFRARARVLAEVCTQDPGDRMAANAILAEAVANSDG